MWIQKIKKMYSATLAFQKAFVMFNNRQQASGPFLLLLDCLSFQSLRSVNLTQKFIIRWELCKTKTYV